MPTVPAVSRPLIHVNVSPEAKQRWDAFAARHGLTMAAFMEILARHLDDAFDPSQLDTILIEARELAHERRRAGGPRPVKQPKRK